MKKNFLFAIIACSLIAFWSCSKEEVPESGGDFQIDNLSFVSRTVDLLVGQEVKLDLVLSSGGVEKEYTSDNPYGIVWISSASDVASVDASGKVTAHVPGTTSIVARTADKLKQASQTIHVINPDILTSELTEEMIYEKGYMLSDNSVMQGFDFGLDGITYYSQVGRGTNNYNTVINRRNASGMADGIMNLPYSGHGQNLSAELVDGETYLWIGSYGTRASTNEYRNSQTVTRVKFASGRSLKPYECTEQFWYPSRLNMQVALDTDNDMVAFWCLNSGGARYLYIYHLSDVMNIVPEYRELSFSITYGGGVTGDPSISGKPEVLVRDLSSIDPLYTIVLTATSPLTVSPDNIQAHEIKNGKIYLLEGAGNDNDGKEPSYATVSIIDFEGNLVGRCELNIGDMGKLNSLGLTDTGFFEPEAIKCYDGILYCGFASRSSDDIRRVSIIKYDMTKM